MVVRWVVLLEVDQGENSVLGLDVVLFNVVIHGDFEVEGAEGKRRGTVYVLRGLIDKMN